MKIVSGKYPYLAANALSDVYYFDPVESKKHYFTTSVAGITEIRSYKHLFIPEVLPNVDWHHTSNTKGLKSYFVFTNPHESISAMRLQVSGALSKNPFKN